MSKARDIADLDFNSPDIDGGNIDGATIGGTTPAAGSFTALTANNVSSGDTYFTGGTANTRLLNIFTSDASGGSHAVHNFKIASGAGEFIFGNNNVSNILKLTQTGSTFAGTVTASSYFLGSGSEISLATGSAGNIFLRPNGQSTSGQMKLASSGAATFNSTIATGSGGGSGTVAITGATATGEQAHATFTNTQGAKTFAVGGGQSGVTNNGFVIRNVTDNTFPLVISDAGAATFNSSVTATKANVGTSTANYSGTDLTVGDNADSQNGLAIQTSTSGVGYILFGDGSGASAYRGEINYAHATDSMTFKTAGAPRLTIDSAGNVRFNPGVIDSDFTVSSDGYSHMLHVDGANNQVNIGTASNMGGLLNVRRNTASSFSAYFENLNASGYGQGWNSVSGHQVFMYHGGAHVGNISSASNFIKYSTGSSADLKLQAGGTREVVVNDDGADTNFRVESDSYTHMFFVDAGNNRASVGAATTPYHTFETWGPTQANGSAKANFLVMDTASGTTGTGGGIALGGYFNGTSDIIYHFGNIQGIKENSTAGNYASAMIFSTRANGSAPTEKFRIASDGTATFTGGIIAGPAGVSTADHRVPAGAGYITYSPGNASSDVLNIRKYGTTQQKFDQYGVNFPVGIKFGTDTAAANTLDDYEEGTWTPTITGYGQATPHSQAYSVQTGNYTKVGNLVTAHFFVTLSNKGNIASASGNYAFITGLPFNHGGSVAGIGVMWGWQSLTNAVSHVAADISSTNTQAWLTQLQGTSAVGTTYMGTSQITNLTSFRGTLIYKSA